MRTRQQLEQIEKQILQPYAATSATTKGREHPEDEHLYRTAFQRDRDRIIHSSAFRRLEYKTQVFINHEGDYYRTRLTHTLEVSQIARVCARALGVNEDVADSIALAHDLGHTPFGHSGQDQMNEIMKDHGGFEHNKQSFRIVTQLENPYPDFIGLNLTYEVLDGISKHITEYDMPDNSLFVKEGYPSIEAQITNFADEIAYNSHDVDDGLKSGLITAKGLKDVKLWQTYFKKFTDEHVKLTPTQQRRYTVKAIINHLVSDLIKTTSDNIEKLGIKTIEDVHKNGCGLVSLSQETKKANKELKAFLYQNLYTHEKVLKMQDEAKVIVAKLFQTFMEKPFLIPDEFKKFYTNENPERIVCDYIAGMTDRYALGEYEGLGRTA
ncbi:MAG: deoxyguanosinetriphosphate triphosphohydrolase [bacterium]|nr:deoxyguanosinetriphosphate triphosphohydrolase [bacterium]